jgi:hypothetical protein
VGTPELLSDVVEIAFGKRGAHARARIRTSRVSMERLGTHLEADALAESPERREITGAVSPEAEVLADDHAFRAELTDEEPLDELLGLDARERGVERLDHDQKLRIDSTDELDLALERRERWQDATPEHLGGVRVKGEHDGLQSLSSRSLGARPEHGPMAAVHTVEVPDDDERRPGLRVEILRSIDTVLRHGAPCTTTSAERPRAGAALLGKRSLPTAAWAMEGW